MKISIRQDLCIGSGECVFSAPAVFDQDDDGFVVVLDAPLEGNEDEVRAAAHACPAKVISIE